MSQHDTLELADITASAVDTLFRLKDFQKAFNVNYHFAWIEKHWNKLLKAVSCEKWKLSDEPYAKCDVARSRVRDQRRSFVTNIFSKQFVACRIEKETITYTKVPYLKYRDKYEVIADERDEDISYVYTKAHLKNLGENSPKAEDALATIYFNLVDYKKGKYISFIECREDIYPDDSIIFLAMNQIQASIRTIAEYERTRTLLAAMTMQSMNTFRTFRRF